MTHKFLLPKSFLYLFLAAVLGACSCGGHSDPQGNTALSASSAAGSSAKMIQLIKEAQAKVDPTKVDFYNSAKADFFKQQIEQTTDPQQKFMLYLQYAYETLSSGRNEEAIGEFEKLFEQAKSMNANLLYTLKKLLAISYIRLNEYENCIQRYNDESCLMPFRGKGIYTVKEASRRAISLYESMLEERPDDHENVWMLNFAYMTLGEYPQKVPRKWLIPESAFKSDYQVPVFPNISQKIGVSTVGLAGGTAIDDFNNDGLLDFIASSWGFNDQIRLFINEGNGHFSEKTNEAGLTGLTGGLNTVHADYNNDGFTDVLVLRGAWYNDEGKIPNSLLRNNGNGTFTDVTIEAGLLAYAPTQAAVWADFDNDGWLDLFIANESANLKHPCEFYFNNRNGTFTNRINELGMGQLFAYFKGCAAGDVNNDGWMDLYLSSINSENLLLLNNGPSAGNNGSISFKNITAEAGVKEPIISFPTWFFDFNNDGWEDLFVGSYGEGLTASAAHLAALNYRGQRVGGNPRLYLNNGNGTFTDIANKGGLSEGLFTMGSSFGDIDNDGWLDMYLGTGAPGFTAVVPNKMYRNNLGKSVQDVTSAGGFGHIQKGHGIGFGDFDNDGDQDIFAVIGGALEGDIFANAFFLNPIGNQKSWITVKLEGTTANRSAIGARVKIVTLDPDGRERQIFRTVSTGGSFGGNSLQLETGLDNATKVKSIEVTWPNIQQTKQTFQGIDINRFIKIKEGKPDVEYLQPASFSFN